MKIPNYWSSHKIQFDYKNKPREVFRFGWSDISQNHAKHHAIERCDEARTRILAGEKFVKRNDNSSKYLDESGLPIREQVVQRYDDLHAVTTINSYGATCLNVENVLILDIDNAFVDDRLLKENKLYHQPTYLSLLYSTIILFTVGIYSINHFYLVDFKAYYKLALIILGIVLWLSTFALAMAVCEKRLQKKRQTIINHYLEPIGGYMGWLNQTLEPFLTENPQACFNLYQTPQGFRLIALHDNFFANDDFTQACFERLPVDSIYQRLCKQQQCFRARVTGKPWRMGIHTQFLGYQDFWRDDIPAKFQQQNQQWLAHYQTIAKDFSACHFVKRVGNGTVNGNVLAFIELHDTLCKAKQALPLA